MGCVLCLGFAHAAPPTQIPRPFLWKIEGPGKPSWLFGTIHLQRPDVATPPAAVRAALDEADAVYTEIPLDAATMLALAPQMLLPAGQSLDAILGPALTAAYEKELRRISPALTLAPLAHLKPWAAAATLLELEDQLKYPGVPALDMALFRRAEHAGKETGGLETPAEQLAIFDDLSPGEQAAMVRDTIAQIRAIREGGRSPSDLLAGLYLAGDLDALVAELNKLDFVGEDPELAAKLLDRLLVRRNATMVRRIVEKLRAHPEETCFFAVGAAHLQGDAGLLAALEKAGYRVSRTP